MKWNFRSTASYSSEQIEKELAPTILDIFQNGMGVQGWSVAGVKFAMTNSDLLGILEDEYQNCSGFFFAKISTLQYNGMHVLWAYASVIHKELQGKGMVNEAIDMCRSQYDNIGWLGSRTQNPAVMRLHDKIRIGHLFPFDQEYSQEMMHFLIVHFEEVSEPYMQNRLEINTGICRKIYEKRLGDYPEKINTNRNEHFENKLQQWNFDRNAGDSIILLNALK